MTFEVLCCEVLCFLESATSPEKSEGYKADSLYACAAAHSQAPLTVQ